MRYYEYVDCMRIWDIIVISMLLEVGYRGYIDVISKWDIMDVLLV